MKIIASDFDDTLYIKNDISTTKDNIDSIKRFITNGNIFIIITGRSYSNIKVVLNELNIPYSYLVCEDGAKIFNNMDYCMDTTYMKKEDIKKIIPLIEKEDYYLDDGYNETNNINDTVKVVVNCSDKSKSNEIINTINKHVDTYIYASNEHINIVDKSINKQKGLEKLFYIEDLDFDNLFVIGDNDNDLEMLKEYNGAIITNHSESLDILEKPTYDTLKDFIDDIIKN